MAGKDFRIPKVGAGHRRFLAEFSRGFTLVEMIVVLVVIGVLSAVAVARYFSSSTFDAFAYAEQVKALIRYGQKVAIATNNPVFVRIQADGAALCFDVACSATVYSAGTSNSGSTATKAYCKVSATYDSAWACEGRPDGLTLTPATIFYFDALGKPYASGDATTAFASSFSTSVITIASTIDGSTKTFTVESETGYVY